MALYTARDIETTFAGDLVVDARGDLKVAEAAESLLAAMKMAVSCDRGELAGHPSLGSNLGTLIGSTDIEEVLAKVPVLVREALAEQGAVATGDVIVRAFQVDHDKAVVYLMLSGEFLMSDGTVRPTTELSAKWLFPYVSGRLEALE